MKKEILIVENNLVDLKNLDSLLSKYSYSTVLSRNGKEALRALDNKKFLAAILDLNLPDISGLELLKSIRNHPLNGNISILMVSINEDVLDTVVGLEMGADDYISKPFHPRELIARLNANIRRSKQAYGGPGPIIFSNDLSIDSGKRRVLKAKKVIDLTFKEFEILHLLASNPGKVITRGQILDKIGSLDYNPNTRVVDVHLSSIRKKLGNSGKNNTYIDTISGVGYKFRE